MSNFLKVAVSQRVEVCADRHERRDMLGQRLCQWLIAAGCIPVPVPNAISTIIENDDAWQNWLHAVKPDVVLLSGGNDIGEMQDRDNTEFRLLAYAKDHCLPALGICRGMQMMAVWAGGNIKPVNNHVRTRHRLQITDTGEWPDEVNSFHNFSLAECPDEFVVTARAEDGEIEAMRHKTLPWEGWMWHPERELQFNTTDTMRFHALLNYRGPI